MSRNWTVSSFCIERPVIVKSDVECSFCFTNILQLASYTSKNINTIFRFAIRCNIDVVSLLCYCAAERMVSVGGFTALTIASTSL